MAAQANGLHQLPIEVHGRDCLELQADQLSAAWRPMGRRQSYVDDSKTYAYPLLSLVTFHD